MIKICTKIKKYYAVSILFLIFELELIFNHMKYNRLKSLRDLQLNLFADEETSSRQSAERLDVVSAITPVALDVVKCILTKCNEYLDFADKHPVARQQPNFVTGNIQPLILEALIESGHFKAKCLNANTSYQAVEFAGYVIWVKKLNDGLFPNVNLTKASVKRVLQKSEQDEIEPVLIFGYQLDDTQRITGLYLTYMLGDKFLWSPINLGDIASSMSETKILSHCAGAEDDVLVAVKPNKKNKTNVV